MAVFPSQSRQSKREYLKRTYYKKLLGCEMDHIK
jgi:hypothetical protein